MSSIVEHEDIACTGRSLRDHRDVVLHKELLRSSTTTSIVYRVAPPVEKVATLATSSSFASSNLFCCGGVINSHNFAVRVKGQKDLIPFLTVRDAVHVAPVFLPCNPRPSCHGWQGSIFWSPKPLVEVGLSPLAHFASRRTAVKIELMWTVLHRPEVLLVREYVLDEMVPHAPAPHNFSNTPLTIRFEFEHLLFPKFPVWK
mmetsp:Transcript_21725/g.42694  ORF Transcript_21725/g.42694 Transcript_21725/m.42694 type:complete len:201 (-) Transcript_21725:777-1379(-)